MRRCSVSARQIFAFYPLLLLCVQLLLRQNFVEDREGKEDFFTK